MRKQRISPKLKAIAVAIAFCIIRFSVIYPPAELVRMKNFRHKKPPLLY